ncbi:hypothetical protein MKX01_003964 [Papaver californicum]|nr:hypothetical protein MKX01_003964 [Papaver californicum]
MPPKVEMVGVRPASSLTPKIGEDDNIGNVSNTITSSSFHSWDVNVDDDIVYEILSRLPVKSLMRFKCVSKHWHSIIHKDPYFIDLHLNQSKARTRLLVTVPRERNGFTRPRDENLYPLLFFLATADLLWEGGEMPTVVNTTTTRELDVGWYRITKPLNGLICLFDFENNHGVRVCNLSTREVTAWIKSTFISNLDVEDKDEFPLSTSRCNLGFDPATKEHKVICIWNIGHLQVCEVLTLRGGDRTWRMIDDVVPAYNFKVSSSYGDSVYVNGSVYYNPNLVGYGVKKDDGPKFIVAFDVGKEKFRAIEIPDFILDQIPLTSRLSSVQLLEIDGHPALSSGISRDIFKLWLFDNEYNNGYRTNTWTAFTIELPIYLGYGVGRLRFHSVTGTDFIILYFYRWNEIWRDHDFAPEVSYYSYNWSKKIFAEIKINGLPSSGPHLKFVPCISTFAESFTCSIASIQHSTYWQVCNAAFVNAQLWCLLLTCNGIKGSYLILLDTLCGCYNHMTVPSRL